MVWEQKLEKGLVTVETGILWVLRGFFSISQKHSCASTGYSNLPLDVCVYMVPAIDWCPIQVIDSLLAHTVPGIDFESALTLQITIKNNSSKSPEPKTEHELQENYIKFSAFPRKRKCCILP